jgi:protein phosphatase
VIKRFRRLFEKKKPVSVGVETAPLSDEALQTVTVVSTQCKPPQLLVGSAQSVGKQREHNEDTLLSISAVVSDGDTGLPFGIFIVADGMGGHQHGEIASGVAARSMAEFLIKKLYAPLFGANPETQNDSLHEIMDKAVHEAQQLVIRKAPGGGTTLTAAIVIGEQVTLAHVGDSRAYFIYPDGRIQIMTQDHSLVRRLVELGQLTEEEAATHPQRNVLYRAVGQVEPFQPDINTYLLPHPGYMMLCSDGLWGVVPQAEIFKIVTSQPNPILACNELVEAANNAGGPDNISALLVQYVN